MGDVYDEDLEIRSDDMSRIDSDYEYDAPNFFDFTSPELPSEAEVAERWFRFTPTNTPSREFFDGETSSYNSVDCQNKDSLNGDPDVRMVFQDSTPNRLLQKYKPKSPKPYLPRSSTLLKPTASHLAKLCRPDDHSPRSTGRSPRSPSPHYHSSWDIVATNKQKLEFSCSKKKQAALLKGQSSFGQKSPKMVRTKSLDFTHLKSKFTTPKGPELETTLRAQRHRSIKGDVQEDIEKSKHYNCKAQLVSRKIMEGPLLINGRKSAPCLAQLQFSRVSPEYLEESHTSHLIKHFSIVSESSEALKGMSEFKCLKPNSVHF